MCQKYILVNYRLAKDVLSTFKKRRGGGEGGCEGKGTKEKALFLHK